ncbi:MAG: permease, partial [Armatimonadetes bacterium]|nr:permease [Armatimonadota bacterium]
MDHKGIVNVFRCCILTWDFLPVVLPAFLVAGAIAVFVPKDFIARYMGPRAKWWVSYPAATLGGVAISMCSCNIVPVAASIYARGAGIGPA